jgi:hypothetical protein
MCDGYELRQEKQWEIARWQACVMINSNIPRGKPILQPWDLIKLSIDKEEKLSKKGKVKKLYTPEEFAQLKKRLGIG